VEGAAVCKSPQHTGARISGLLTVEVADGQIRATERKRDKLRYCFRRAMTPTLGDRGVLCTPASLSFLYYPFRAVRLAIKYGLRPLKSPSPSL